MKESIVTSSPVNEERRVQLYCFTAFVALYAITILPVQMAQILNPFVNMFPVSITS